MQQQFVGWARFSMILFSVGLFSTSAPARVRLCGGRVSQNNQLLDNNGFQQFGNNFNNIPILDNNNGFNNIFDPANGFNQFGNQFSNFNNGFGNQFGNQFSNFNNGFGNQFGNRFSSFNNGFGNQFGNQFSNFNNGFGNQLGSQFNNGNNNLANQFGNQFGNGFGSIQLTDNRGLPISINGFRDQNGSENFIDATGRTFSVPRDSEGNPLDARRNVLRVAFDNNGAFLIGTDRNGNLRRIPTLNGQRIRPLINQSNGQNQFAQNGQGQQLGQQGSQLGSLDANGITPIASEGGDKKINAEPGQPHAPSTSVSTRGIVSTSNAHGLEEAGVDAANGRPEL